MKKVIGGVIVLFLMSMWTYLYYGYLEWSLHGSYYTYMADPVYDVATGECINCEDLAGRRRGDTVPAWSYILDIISEGLLLFVPVGWIGLTILFMRITKNIVSRNLRWYLPVVVFCILVHCTALAVALNS